MAVTRTNRFKLHRWDSGSDPINRAQSDLDNLQIETLGAIFREGADASKGVASDVANVKSFYNATDTNILYYSNGTSWLPLNDYAEAADIIAITIGASAAAGTSTEIARADHTHAFAASGTAPASVATTASVGVSTAPARSDHVHAIGTGAINASSMFSAGIVDTAALGTNSVTTVKITDLNVTTAKIADANITAAKIGTGAVTPLKIDSTLAGNGISRDGITGILSVNPAASGGLAVSASGVAVATSGITSTMIADSSVIAAKIATDAVTPLKIASSIAGDGITRNVTTGVLSVNAAAGGGLSTSVSGVSVASLGITAAMIADGVISDVKLAANSVTATKIATGAVTPLKVDSTIAGNGISRDVGTGILSVNPAAGGGLAVSASGVSVTTSGISSTMIADSAVIAAKIATGAVTPLKVDSTIVGSGVTAGGLQRNAGTGVLSVLPDSTTLAVNGSGQIAIASGGVSATQLAANAVIDTKIQDAAVTPLKIASTIVGTGATAGGLQRSGVTGVLSVLTDSSTVTVNGSGQIAVGTVTNSNVADDSISPRKLTTAVAGNGLSRNATTGVLTVSPAASGGITVDATGVYITALGVTEARIADAAVTVNKIGTGAVVEAKIADGAVTVNKIGTGAVTPLKIDSTIVGTGATAGGLQRNVGTGVLSVLTDATTVAVNGSGQLSIPANGVNTTQIAASAVTGAKVGAGVYRNVNSLTTGGRIEFTTLASLPTVGSALTGAYTNGDIIFGY